MIIRIDNLSTFILKFVYVTSKRKIYSAKFSEKLRYHWLCFEPWLDLCMSVPNVLICENVGIVRMQLQCMNQKQLIIGEHEFNITTTARQNNRIPQYSMTNDPEKVWPGGVVHYVMDKSLGRYITAYLSCSLHTCTLYIYLAPHTGTCLYECMWFTCT